MQKRKLNKKNGTWRKTTKPRSPCPAPKSFSTDEVLELVQQYKSQSNKFWCPLTNKTYANMVTVVRVMAAKMESSCLNHYMFLLQEPHYSKYSGKLLTEEDYSFSQNYKGWTGFKKYTKEEREKRVWSKTANRSSFKTKEAREKRSQAIQAFWTSDAGMQLKKEKSEQMLEFYQTEDGKKRKHEASIKGSETMKKLIAEGSFTPNITNSWTHWNAHICLKDGTIKRFRSSWEACFYYSNRHLLYETIRIKTESRTFINDFFDESTNTLYEIKPRNRYNIEIDKMTALQNFCTKKGYKFVWINEHNLLDYVDIQTMLKDEKNKIQLEKATKNQIIKKAYESKRVAD